MPLWLTIVIIYLSTTMLALAVSWPQTHEDMPGGGWRAVYLRAFLWPLFVVLVIIGLILGVVFDPW